MMNYDQIRLQVLERDEHQCRMCHNKGIRLHVHHIIPRQLGGTDVLDNLLTVCRKCHNRLEPKSHHGPTKNIILSKNPLSYRGQFSRMGNKIILIIPKAIHEDVKKMNKPFEVSIQDIEI